MSVVPPFHVLLRCAVVSSLIPSEQLEVWLLRQGALLERPLVLLPHLLLLLGREVVLDVERLSDLLGRLTCCQAAQTERKG